VFLLSLLQPFLLLNLLNTKYYFQVDDFASVIGSVDAILKRKGFDGFPVDKYVESLRKKYSKKKNYSTGHSLKKIIGREN
jgi:hypothetical protein